MSSFDKTWTDLRDAIEEINRGQAARVKQSRRTLWQHLTEDEPSSRDPAEERLQEAVKAHNQASPKFYAKTENSQCSV